MTTIQDYKDNTVNDYYDAHIDEQYAYHRLTSEYIPSKKYRGTHRNGAQHSGGSCGNNTSHRLQMRYMYGV